MFPLKGNAALNGTALAEAAFGSILLPNATSPRAVDLLPIFYTGVPNLAPYQLATGKGGNPLAVGKPFINNFLPTLGDLLRLNMAVPATPRNDPKFSSLGLVQAAALGLTDPAFNGNKDLQFIPNMDGFPNGRRLEDDVTTIELQAVGGVVLAAIGLWYDDFIPGTTASPVTPNLVRVLSYNAGVTKNDAPFKTMFPYEQNPWRGFNGNSYAGKTTSARVAAKFIEEPTQSLKVRVLGNPTTNDEVVIEIMGAEGQAVQTGLSNIQGQLINQRSIENASNAERQTIRLGRQPGTYILQVSTPTEKQSVKIIRQQ